MAAFEKIVNVQHAWPGSSRANLPPNMRHTHASHQNPILAPEADMPIWRRRSCRGLVKRQAHDSFGVPFTVRNLSPSPDPIRSTPQIGGGSTARSIALKTSRDGLLSTASRIPSLTGIA